MIHKLPNAITVAVMCATGVTLVGGKESTGNDAVSATNVITNYHHITARTHGLLFRCVSGLGPATGDRNIELGDLYFRSERISNGDCNGPHLQPRGATISNYVGVINVFLCHDPTLDDEGVYTCTMTNSNMAEESVRVGIYLPGRSKVKVFT